MWAIKFTAALCVAAGCSWTGWHWGLRLRLRREALQDVLLLLQLVQARLECGSGLWLKTLVQVAGQANFHALNFTTQIFDCGSLVTSIQTWLGQADREHLLPGPVSDWVCSALCCALTRQETKTKLAYYIHLLTEQLEEARCAERRDRRLFVQIGCLGGVLLTLILW